MTNTLFKPDTRVFVAGHRGLVGRALRRQFAKSENVSLFQVGRELVDLRDPLAVDAYFREHEFDVVLIAAARVGGIQANKKYPVQFLADNLRIALNCIESAYETGVRRLLFLGSTCIYPRDAQQPIEESSLLTSSLEASNEGYALAKIAGLKLCEYYRRQFGAMFHSIMPANLYGPGDNYHPEHGHVVAALLRRIHEAKLNDASSVTIWGTGTARREFLHVDDLARAAIHMLKVENPPDWVNVGTGQDISILELAREIADVVGFKGRIQTDPSKPDGTPRKVADVSLIQQLGWRHEVELREGLRSTYQSFLSEFEHSTLRHS